jgi:hypothetical protein
MMKPTRAETVNLQILLFGFVLTNEIRDANIAVLDHSKDQTTAAITQKLTASGYFSFDPGKSLENKSHTTISSILT